MATRHMEGGASALPNVLPFPVRNTGRIRRSRSMMSAGKCALLIIEREGEDAPANVVRIDVPKPPAPVERSPMLLLTLCLYFEASAKAREGIKRNLRGMAYSGDEDAIALLAFLRREA